jgi:protein O-mannosyl-transferase
VLHCLLLVIATTLLYARTAGFEFVYDDHHFVVNNPAIRSVRFLPRYFTDTSTYCAFLQYGMYRPLRNISYLLDYKLAGLRPGWYHLHNVLLHAAVSCLVYAVLLLCLRKERSDRPRLLELSLAACVGALIWAIHPVHTEVVAWIKSRDELLFSFWYLVGLYLYLRGLYAGSISAATSAGILLCYAMALMAKEMALSFPVLCIAAFVLYGSRQLRTAWFGLILMLGMLSVGFVLVRHRVLGQTEQVGYLAGGFWPEMFTMAHVIVRYFTLMFFPHDLVVSYETFPISRSFWQTGPVLGATLLVGTVGMAVLLRRRMPALSFGIAWFWLTLLPVSNIVPTMQHLAERFLYLPSIGVVLACGAAALSGSQQVAREFPRRASLVLTIVLFCMLTGLMAATSVRLFAWKNEVALFASAVRVAPNAPSMIRCYATALSNDGRYAEALPWYQKLYRLQQEGGSTVSRKVTEQGYGLTLIQLGRYQEGIEHARIALELEPTDIETYRHLSYGLWRAGQTTEARDLITSAIKLQPGNAALLKQKQLFQH